MLAALPIHAQKQGPLAADLLGLAVNEYLINATLEDAGLIDSEGERKHKHELCERFALQPW